MIKISELPSASALGGTEVVAGVQSSVTVKVLISQIGAYVRGLFTTTPATLAEGGTGAASAGAARTALGLAIGTDVQAYNANLTTWAGIVPGTGVATALAVNIGSAGSPVVNGGALGTPSSGTLTNCAGYPAAQQTIVQVVEATPYTTYSSSATAIPYDDTIPQNTEGAEWATATITPANATNRLRIEAEIPQCTSSAAEVIVAALFQDTTANALAVSAEYAPAGSTSLSLRVSYEMAAGTTSATTFKLRAGSAAGTIYVNGTTAARKFGGVSAIRLRVTEIKV